jgi:hypothetical protein
LSEAALYKEEGNNHFKNKEHMRALRSYHKAILHLAGIVGKSSPVAMYASKTASEAITT